MKVVPWYKGRLKIGETRKGKPCLVYFRKFEGSSGGICIKVTNLFKYWRSIYETNRP